MSVDYSVTIGVGFRIPDSIWAAFIDRVDTEGEYGDTPEIFYYKLFGIDGLGFSHGGSYMDGETVPYIYLDRLTTTYSTYDWDQGYIGAKTDALPPLGEQEIDQLWNIAAQLGDPNELLDFQPTIENFVAFLVS